ncbi:MAG TPA: bacillithiol biosynthesis cysteine-adding enzyme BshC [Flavobacteriaceae bacterium]|nr:bacillithiol biosynthesis cysteine-adding enzyme BshC [Flavobacteriaceae bacterium]MCB9212367.1 bacillithiol biosynthesis cysteine-adding enzyme BshC [Alteromonas sp.]HPF11643.1 bacillithiol biosynthesis cysteine-adding enzyme BshC [Flavobacteriaceae bacterium]HQU20118.1 bacillithiol biosynthesis cysteine-adding enzyme BshC [Flavobacteriaceae bacterium]HQU64793.1 bacillithiol biosynthesis cysteine-adding enzyme BshC [Flavobacteriaceae bacterium]
MPKQFLPYTETGYFSQMMTDYVKEAKPLKSFYHRFPSETNFLAQLEEKQQFFSKEMRCLLADRLQWQYRNCSTSETTLNNIASLKNSHTFTITTGHQLNLFTGPLYFLYKIFSTINLCESLCKKYPSFHFVPVYWMATEDHDFDEINYFNYKNKKVVWNRPTGGAVGEFSTQGLDVVFETLKKEWGASEFAKALLQLFQKAYLEHDRLAEATRYLANALFQEYGLVILDGHDPELKKYFAPFAVKELTEGLSHKKVTETTGKLVELGYMAQVYPREINLFYMQDGIRERLIEEEGNFHINGTTDAFGQGSLLETLHQHPERFSPNALLRPLYQEVLLPNLCYIGGGGELAYWMQLKGYFESVQVPFPILLLRNSALLVPKKVSEKLQKMEVPLEKLFLEPHELASWYTQKLSEIAIDFSTQRNHLKQQFKELYTLAQKTDASFLGAVAAQEKKQLNGLDKLEKRLLKAQKRKLSSQLERLTELKEELFPHGNLQERVHNFSEWYLEFGPELFEKLKAALDPLKKEFMILEL